MLRTSALTFAIVTAVTSGAIVGTAAMGPTPTDSTSCTCSTIDLDSGSVTLAVLSEGTGSASVSQQISQVNGDARVEIDVDYGETSVGISGETAENGSLVLNVTQDGEVVNESIVVDGAETETVVFRLDSDGVRVNTDEELPSECMCGEIDADVASDVDVESDADLAGDVMDEICDAKPDVQVNVDEDIGVNVGDVREDTNVNAGNVSVNVPMLSLNTGDGGQSAESNQVIQDSGDDHQSQSNVNESGECAKASGGDASISDSASGQSSASSKTAGNVFRIVVSPTDFTGLSGGSGEKGISIGGVLSEWGYGSETGDESN